MDELEAAERRKEFLAIMRGRRRGEVHPSLRTAYEVNRQERRRLVALGIATGLVAAATIGLLLVLFV